MTFFLGTFRLEAFREQGSGVFNPFSEKADLRFARETLLAFHLYKTVRAVLCTDLIFRRAKLQSVRSPLFRF